MLSDSKCRSQTIVGAGTLFSAGHVICCPMNDDWVNSDERDEDKDGSVHDIYAKLYLGE